MDGADSDFDGFRDDFVVYLAKRLNVPHDAAATYLGNWLVAFSPLLLATQSGTEQSQGSVVTAAQAETEDR